MKPNNSDFRLQVRRVFYAGGLVLATLATVACSDNASQKVEAAQLQVAGAKPASMATASSSSTAKAPELKPIAKTTPQAQGAKVLRYRSRDYAVSFEYPWQYSFANARTVHQVAALQPAPDGTDGQITLARVDLPKGFYPDTDFESGYLALSLNTELDETQCKATLNSGTSGGLHVSNINGTDFSWIESEKNGKGGASKVRNYVAFANDVCYEFELGLKTSNEDGLAREVNSDQVMRRLEGMLQTVRFEGAQVKAPALQSSNAAQPAEALK